MSLGVIVVSTFCFILSTFPEFQDEYVYEEELEELVVEESGKDTFNSKHSSNNTYKL